MYAENTDTIRLDIGLCSFFNLLIAFQKQQHYLDRATPHTIARWVVWFFFVAVYAVRSLVILRVSLA